MPMRVFASAMVVFDHNAFGAKPKPKMAIPVFWINFLLEFCISV